MAFGQTTLIAALVANGVLLALFVYLGIENFQLSKADDTSYVENRKPWLDKFLKIVVGILSLALVLIAVTMGNGYFFGF